MTTSGTVLESALKLPRSRFQALLRRRATWVMVDQGVVSAGNFITANLVARNLPQSQYGLFAILLETMLYLNSLQAALVIYPLTVKGASGDRENLGSLATASILLSALLLPILGGATVLSVGALQGWNYALAAAAAMFLWQLQETTRRGLMSDLRFGDAVWGDSVSYLLQAALVFLLAHYGKLTLNTAFIVMGVTSAGGMVIQACQIGLKRVHLSQVRVIAKDFWHLGRWMLLSNGGTIVSSISYWWVLKIFHGLDSCAVYGAIVALFKLANPVMNSIGGLITPSVARAEAQQGRHAANRAAIRYGIFGAVLLFPYFAALALFPHFLMRLAYGANSPYISIAPLVRLFVLNYALCYALAAVGAWTSGLSKSRINFYAQVVNMTGAVLIGIPLAALYGVAGMIIGAATAGTFCLVSMIWMGLRMNKESTSPEMPPLVEPAPVV